MRGFDSSERTGVIIAVEEFGGKSSGDLSFGGAACGCWLVVDVVG